MILVHILRTRVFEWCDFEQVERTREYSQHEQAHSRGHTAGNERLVKMLYL